MNDNTVNERFKYQCSIDVKNTTFRAYTRYQVSSSMKFYLAAKFIPAAVLSSVYFHVI